MDVLMEIAWHFLFYGWCFVSVDMCHGGTEWANEKPWLKNALTKIHHDDPCALSYGVMGARGVRTNAAIGLMDASLLCTPRCCIFSLKVLSW